MLSGRKSSSSKWSCCRQTCSKCRRRCGSLPSKMPLLRCSYGSAEIKADHRNHYSRPMRCSFCDNSNNNALRTLIYSRRGISCLYFCRCPPSLQPHPGYLPLSGQMTLNISRYVPLAVAFAVATPLAFAVAAARALCNFAIHGCATGNATFCVAFLCCCSCRCPCCCCCCCYAWNAMDVVQHGSRRAFVKLICLCLPFYAVSISTACSRSWRPLARPGIRDPAGHAATHRDSCSNSSSSSSRHPIGSIFLPPAQRHSSGT